MLVMNGVSMGTIAVIVLVMKVESRGWGQVLAMKQDNR